MVDAVLDLVELVLGLSTFDVHQNGDAGDHEKEPEESGPCDQRDHGASRARLLLRGRRIRGGTVWPRRDRCLAHARTVASATRGRAEVGEPSRL